MIHTQAKRREVQPLRLRAGLFDWSRPYVMGVLNVTPDSFSDGGILTSSLDLAIAEARAMQAAGADVLDIGGESTRPQALPVSATEELRRVLPLIEALSTELTLPLSIDTTKAAVARAAVAAGAQIVNDISGGLFDPEMISTVHCLDAAFICGHVRGQTISQVHASVPATFDDVLSDLRGILNALPGDLLERTIIDPCIGFSKDLQTNLELVQRAGELSERLGPAILVGPSRKRFLGEVTGLPVDDRDAATVGACLASVSGGAHMVRVHNVAMTKAALQVFCAARSTQA